MTDDDTPLLLEFSHILPLKQRKVISVQFEIDKSQWNKVNRYMGEPDSGNWFFITRANMDVINAKGANLSVEHQCVDGETGSTHLETPKNGKPYGKQAKALILSGFFKHLSVWQEIAPEPEYFEWVWRQKSCISGAYSYGSDKYPDGYCVQAHILKVEQGSGKGIKPPYFVVPLTVDEHNEQHQHGYSVLGKTIDELAAIAFKHLETFMRGKLKAHLGYDSLGAIPPTVLLEWCETRNLTMYLPNCYKEGL